MQRNERDALRMSISSVPCGSSTGFVKGSPLSEKGEYALSPFRQGEIATGRLHLRRGDDPAFLHPPKNWSGRHCSRRRARG